MAAALTLVGQSGAKGPTPPCQGNEDATTYPSQKTITGSNGADIIQANDKDNVIYGLAGPDTICAYKGEDQVFGGKGGDDLWGEHQNDELSGGRQADTLRGGTGPNDVCKGGDPPAPSQGAQDPDNTIQCEQVSGAS